MSTTETILLRAGLLGPGSVPWPPPFVAGPAPEPRPSGQGLDNTLGSIATVQGPFAFGPRPGDPSNVMHAPEYDVIDDIDERSLWRAAFAARRYARWPVGPILEVPSYDGNYPSTDWTRDQSVFLARMDELIADGFVLNFHAIPDTPPARVGNGGSAAEPNWEWLDRVLKPIYQSAAFQTRFREVTIAWEPEWTSATWVRAARWVRECFPDALIWAHMPPGHSAPGMGNEGEADCMHAIAPFINGIRFQSGQFGDRDFKPNDDGTPSRRTRLQQFLREVWDICRRLKFGVGDWPTTGHNGAPLVCDASEYLSYWVYHNRATEAEAVAWGRALRETPPYEDPDNHGEIVDLSLFQPIILGDGGPTVL